MVLYPYVCIKYVRTLVKYINFAIVLISKALFITITVIIQQIYMIHHINLCVFLLEHVHAT